jgi:hypothetical protein
LYNCIANKQGKFSTSHQIRQQESVLSPNRGRVEQATFNFHTLSSNRESGRVQVPNATIGLKHVVLKCVKPQFLGSADKSRAITGEVELKAMVLR